MNPDTLYDDEGRPVPVVWPDQSCPYRERVLLDAILDSPDEASKLAAIAAAFQSVEDEAGDRRAAETLHTVYERLGRGGKHGMELRAALLAAVGLKPDLAAPARSCGISRQSFRVSVGRLAKRLIAKRSVN